MNDQLTPPQLDILDACLETVLRREKTIADCLAHYPDDAVWLKPQLQTALLLRSLSAPGMPEDAVKTLENRVVRQFNRSMSAPRHNTSVRWVGKWAAGFMVALLIAFGGGTTTVAASANSQPGDVFYGVKRAWENVIVYLATLVGRADEVWLHLAQVRFDEMQTLAAKGNLEPDMLDEVYGAVQRAIVFADSDTTPLLVVFMMSAGSELQIIPQDTLIAAHYDRVSAILEPHFDPSGRLVLLDKTDMPDVPPVQTIAASATAEPTLTQMPTLLPSATPTETPGVFASATFDASATPTRTPTDTPTSTATVTASFTPTLTWTPLPLPAGTLVTATPLVVVATMTQSLSSPRLTPTGALLYPIRPTQLAVYMTQTAIASGEIPTEEVSPP